jgi:hypothetical protein
MKKLPNLALAALFLTAMACSTPAPQKILKSMHLLK